MPDTRSARQFVGVKFDREVIDQMEALAGSEGWTYDHGKAGGVQPSLSEAARRLVSEALEAREGTVRMPVAERGLAWIDGEAQREGVSRDQMVKALLAEARDARERNRMPVNGKTDRRKP